MADLKLALRITADNGQLKAELLNSQSLVRQFGVESKTAASLATGEFTRVRGAVASIKDALNDARRAILAWQALRISFDIGKSFVEAQVQMQRYQYTLENVFGSQQQAAAQMQFLRETSERLGLSLGDAASGYSRLAASAIAAGVSTGQLQQGFIGLADASTVLHMSGADLQGILVQLEQGMSLGRIQMQDLRAIAQHMPSVFDLITKAFEGTGQSVQQMLATGGIPAQEFFLRFTSILRDQYGPEAVKAADSLNAALNRLSTAWLEFRAGALDENRAGDLASVFNGLATTLPQLADAFVRVTEVAGAFVALQVAQKVGAWTAATVASIAVSRADQAAVVSAAESRVAETAIIAQNTRIRAASAATAVVEGSGIARLAAFEEQLAAARQAEMAAAANAAAAEKALVIARGGFTGYIASVQAAAAANGVFAASVKVVGAALVSTAQLALAAWTGWQIGSWLYDQFAIVRRAGGDTVEALLIGAAKVKQYWQQAGVAVADAFSGQFGRIASDMASIGAEADKEIARIKSNFAGDFWSNGKHDSPTPTADGQTQTANVAADAAPRALQAASSSVAMLEAQETLLKDAQAREKADLDAALKANTLSYQGYYDRLAAMQRQALDAQIAVQRAKLAELDAKTAVDKASPRATTSGEDPVAQDLRQRIGLVAQLTVLQRQLGAVGIDTQRQLATANQKLDEQLDGVKLKLLELSDPVAAAQQKVQAQFRQTIALARQLGRTSDLAPLHQLEVAEEQDAAQKAIQQQVQAIADAFRTRTADLAHQVQIGSLTRSQAQIQQSQAHDAAVIQLGSLGDRATQTGGSGLEKTRQVIEQTRVGLGELKAPLADLQRQLSGGLLDGTTKFFSALIQGTQSVKSAFSSMVSGIAQMMADMAAKLLAMKALQALFGALGGMGGASGSFFDGMAKMVSSFATGGHVTGPGSATSDSIPAMLSDGEYVLNARTVRRIGVGMLDALNGGGLPRVRHFASGGLVGASLSSSTLSRSGGVTLHAPISVSVESGDGDSLSDKQRGTLLGAALKSAVTAELLRQKQPGGLLHQQTVTTFG